MMQETADNKRRDHRFRTLKRGRLHYNKGQSSMTCRLRDLSATGAKVQLNAPSTFEFPEDIILEMFDLNDKSIYYQTRRAWQRNDMLGVAILHVLEKDANGHFLPVHAGDDVADDDMPYFDD